MANSGDDGYMKFDLTYDRSAQTVSGYGSDNAGSFAIDGMHDGYNLRFTKQYYNNGPRWIYSGRAVRNPGNNHFSGTWGDERTIRQGIHGGSFTLKILSIY